MLFDHSKWALSQYTPHFYIVAPILEDIHYQLDFKQLSLDKVLKYFYMKSSGELYKLSNKPWIYLLLNKTTYLDESQAYEISGCYTTTTCPLAFIGHNTNGSYIYIFL